MSFPLTELIDNPTLLPSFIDYDPVTVYKEMGLAVDESIVMKDKDGCGLVVFLKKGLQWPWKPTQNVNGIVSNAVATFVLWYDPPSLSKTDLRHKEFNKELQPDCGVYYFAL